MRLNFCFSFCFSLKPFPYWEKFSPFQSEIALYPHRVRIRADFFRRSIQFCYRLGERCVVLCSSMAIYYHNYTQKSTTKSVKCLTFIVKFTTLYNLYKKGRGMVLVIVQFHQNPNRVPGNKSPRNEFFDPRMNFLKQLPLN